MRHSIKKLRGMTDKSQAEAFYSQVTALLDRLACKRVIHPNNASNKKAKLAKFVASLG
jgi:small subunit ribosomal protein S20